MGPLCAGTPHIRPLRHAAAGRKEAHISLCYHTNPDARLPCAGQFGTRLQGGKDAASARYIFTRLEPITRVLFHEADDKLLAYLNEEGQSIEPQWCGPSASMDLQGGRIGRTANGRPGLRQC